MGSLSDSFDVVETLIPVIGDLLKNVLGGSMVWPEN